MCAYVTGQGWGGDEYVGKHGTTQTSPEGKKCVPMWLVRGGVGMNMWANMEPPKPPQRVRNVCLCDWSGVGWGWICGQTWNHPNLPWGWEMCSNATGQGWSEDKYPGKYQTIQTSPEGRKCAAMLLVRSPVRPIRWILSHPILPWEYKMLTLSTDHGWDEGKYVAAMEF